MVCAGQRVGRRGDLVVAASPGISPLRASISCLKQGYPRSRSPWRRANSRQSKGPPPRDVQNGEFSAFPSSLEAPQRAIKAKTAPVLAFSEPKRGPFRATGAITRPLFAEYSRFCTPPEGVPLLTAGYGSLERRYPWQNRVRYRAKPRTGHGQCSCAWPGCRWAP